LNIEQIRYLVAVATFSSINQAATALHLSQPNLSLALKALEDELGYALFSRTNRGVELTAKGMLFLDQAREVLLQFEQLRTLNSQPEPVGSGALSVATMPLCRVHYALTEFYHTSAGQLPKTISVMEAMRDQVIQFVSNSDCEIGVIYVYDGQRKSVISLLNAKNLQCFSLAPCTASVVMGKGNPLFSKKPASVTVEQLKSFYRLSYGKMGRPAYSRTHIPGLSDVAGEIVVDDQIDFQKTLESCPSFSVVPRGKVFHQINDITSPMHFCDIEGVHISGEYMWLRHSSGQLSGTAAEFIGILRNWLM